MNDKLPCGLYALIDDSLKLPMPVVDFAIACARGGAAVVQLRLKGASDRDALSLAKAIIARVHPTLVVVNDRVDIALCAQAHGVHLGDEDLPIELARTVLGPEALIGATVRNSGDIARARALGANYVGLGPVFETTTKRVPHPPLGLPTLAAVVKEAVLPVVAIGGITVATIASVARCGVHCAAVARGLFDGEALNVADLVQEFGGAQ